MAYGTGRVARIGIELGINGPGGFFDCTRLSIQEHRLLSRGHAIAYELLKTHLSSDLSCVSTLPTSGPFFWILVMMEHTT